MKDKEIFLLRNMRSESTQAPMKCGNVFEKGKKYGGCSLHGSLYLFASYGFQYISI